MQLYISESSLNSAVRSGSEWSSDQEGAISICTPPQVEVMGTNLQCLVGGGLQASRLYVNHAILVLQRTFGEDEFAARQLAVAAHRGQR